MSNTRSYHYKSVETDEDDAEGVNVAVVCSLSPTPFMGTLVEHFQSNVHLLSET